MTQIIARDSLVSANEAESPEVLLHAGLTRYGCGLGAVPAAPSAANRRKRRRTYACLSDRLHHCGSEIATE